MAEATREGLSRRRTVPEYVTLFHSCIVFLTGYTELVKLSLPSSMARSLGYLQGNEPVDATAVLSACHLPRIRVTADYANTLSHVNHQIMIRRERGCTGYEDVKEMDPYFTREAFERELRECIVPEVVDAYLSVDKEALSKWCSKAVSNSLSRHGQDHVLF